MRPTCRHAGAATGGTPCPIAAPTDPRLPRHDGHAGANAAPRREQSAVRPPPTAPGRAASAFARLASSHAHLPSRYGWTAARDVSSEGRCVSRGRVDQCRRCPRDVAAWPARQAVAPHGRGSAGRGLEPLDDRYVDDGTVTVGIAKSFRGQRCTSGSTRVRGGIIGREMTITRILGESRRQAREILISVAAVVLALLAVVRSLPRQGTDKEKASGRGRIPRYARRTEKKPRRHLPPPRRLRFRPGRRRAKIGTACRGRQRPEPAAKPSPPREGVAKKTRPAKATWSEHHFASASRASPSGGAIISRGRYTVT